MSFFSAAYPAVLELWFYLGALNGSQLVLAATWGFGELALAMYVGWLTAGRP